MGTLSVANQQLSVLIEFLKDSQKPCQIFQGQSAKNIEKCLKTNHFTQSSGACERLHMAQERERRQTKGGGRGKCGQ